MVNFSSFPLPAAVVRVLLAIILMTLCLPAAAQTPAWQSARVVALATTAAASNTSDVTATAVDAAGNVYLAGEFTNTVVLGGTTLTSLGVEDVFVAKFNPVSNQFVWAQRAGGPGADYANALAVSGTSVYLAGVFDSPTAGFGAATLTNAAPGTNDVFVAKLTDAGSTGSFVWAQRAGGTGIDAASALAMNGTSLYVAGNFFSPTADFGGTTLANAGTTSGTADVFVAKLTDAGSTGIFTWAQRSGGTGSDIANALAVNNANVYVAGYFNSSTADFGTTTLTNAGLSDVFVAKLADAGSTGSFVWAQRAGGTGYDNAFGLAVRGTSVYVAGNFSGSTTNFGATTLTNTNANDYDVFVAKLTDASSTGSFTWAQRAGGTGRDDAYALAVSGSSVYVAGLFRGPTAGFGQSTLTSAGGFDAFVAKLDDAGSTGGFAWALRAGGMGRDVAFALAVSGTSLYVAGSFGNPTADFGPTILTNPNPNSSLGFLAALTDATLTATTAAAGPREPATLFPNPARCTATLRLTTGTPSAPLTFTDALGRTVRRYPAPAGPEVSLDLRGLPAGLYLLHGAGPALRLALE